MPIIFSSKENPTFKVSETDAEYLRLCRVNKDYNSLDEFWNEQEQIIKEMNKKIEQTFLFGFPLE